MSDIFDGLESVLPQDAPAHDHDFRGQLKDAATALKFLRAGNATITLRSQRSGARFTYKVTIPKDRDTGEPVTDGTLMVGVLTGSDNETSYTWLGRVSRDIFWIGRKFPRPGDIGRDAPCAKAFDWTWRQLVRGTMPTELEIWHEGRCGRCGRKLTVPESVAAGFGPECAGRV